MWRVCGDRKPCGEEHWKSHNFRHLSVLYWICETCMSALDFKFSSRAIVELHRSLWSLEASHGCAQRDGRVPARNAGQCTPAGIGAVRPVLKLEFTDCANTKHS